MSSAVSSDSVPNALSILTGPNGPLANLPFQIPQNVLQAASPKDLAVISTEAEKLMAANILFGNPATPYSVPANGASDLSVLGAIYGITPPATSTADSLAEAGATATPTDTTNSASGITMGTSSSDQYLLSQAGAQSTNGAVADVTG